MSKEAFIGTWKLNSSEMRSSSGEVFYPLGEDCQGLLIFDCGGNLSAHLMRPNRPDFVSGDIMRGTTEEVKAAYEGFVAFWGEYRVDEEKQMMIYTVEGSLFPNWIGHTNERYYDFDGEQLTLRTPPFLITGKETVGVLVWDKVT